MDPRQEGSAATPPSGLTINTLGRLEVRRDGEAVPLQLRKTQALLVYLALRSGPHDRGRLAGLLWGDRPEAHARRNLRHALSQLRRSLDPALLTGDRRTVGLNAQVACRVDARTFEAEIERAGRQRAGDPEGAARALQTALDLYGGEFLADFDLPGCPELEEWITRRRAWLHQQALDALAHLASYHEQRGEYGRALHYARRQLALEPWWEEGHRMVMRLLALTGQRSAALAQYETCRRLLQEELGLEPLEETTALYRKLVDWEVGKLGRVPPNFPTSQFTNLPFVGRGDEHATLVAWWEAAWRGNGKLTLVEGEAGVGKTRLVEEVARYAEARGAAVLRGRCYEFGGGLPYQPLAQALRAVFHFPLSTLDLDPVWLAELARLLPELRQAHPDLPKPVQVTGEAARQRLFEAVARLLSAHPAHPAHPLFLFLDDLHWADQSTLDLLHYLVHRLKDAPIWLVGAYRPEEVDLGHPLTRLRQGLGRDHLVHRLALQPLSAEAVGEIARTLVGEEEGEALGAFLYRESEGNPFILVETVSGLQEQGSLVADDDGPLRRGGGGRWRWTGPPQAEVLPVSVQDVVLQRVGRLSEPARRLLALAAVIGRQFDARLLQAAAGRDADAVDESLSEWLARRLILQPATYNPQPTTFYDFSHAKIRAALYRALGDGQRRLLHRRVGEALEGLYAGRLEAVCEQLAHHYEQAGAAEGALTYLPLAAAKAAAVYAYREALGYYDRALALLEKGDGRRWEIQLRRGQALRFLARYDEAITACRRVVESGAGEAGDRLLAAQAATELGAIYRARRDYDQARVWIQRAHRLTGEAVEAEAGERRQAQARAKRALGEVEGEQGNLEAAQGLFEEALALHRALADRRGVAECLNGLGRVLAARGLYDMARQRFEEALAAFRLLGDRQREAACLRAVGTTHWRQGANDAARRAFTESLDIYRAIGDRQGEAHALNNLGLVYIAQGAYEETRRCWEDSVALYRALNLEKRMAYGLHNLGILHMRSGDYAAARRCLEESLVINRATGSKLNQALDLGWLGRLHLQCGEYDEARRRLDAALALDREMGAGEEKVWHLIWQGAVACEVGDLAGARGLLQEAIGLTRRHGTHWGAYEVCWLAAIHLAAGEGEAALSAVRQALTATEAGGQPIEAGVLCAMLGTVHGSGLLAEAEDPAPCFERALALLGDHDLFGRGVALRRYGAYLMHSDGAWAGSEPDRERGQAHLREAREIFARLGARGELAKATRLLAGDDAPRLRW